MSEAQSIHGARAFRGPASALSHGGLCRLRRAVEAWGALRGVEVEAFCDAAGLVPARDRAEPVPVFADLVAEARDWASLAAGIELRAYGEAAAAELRRRGFLRPRGGAHGGRK